MGPLNGITNHGISNPLTRMNNLNLKVFFDSSLSLTVYNGVILVKERAIAYAKEDIACRR